MILLRTILIAFKASPRSALAALWALVRGLRVRARNIICAAAHQGPGYYPLWISAIEPEKVAKYCEASSHVETVPPIVALVFCDMNGSATDAARTIASIRKAFDESATIYCNAVSGRAQLNCFDLPNGILGDLLDIPPIADPNSWLLPMIAGDEIAPHARKAITRALACSKDSPILFWDEDRLDGRRRFDPWLKPDWDELLFLARESLVGAGLFRANALFDPKHCHREMPISPQAISQSVISLVSRDGPNPAFHIPLVLSHRKVGSRFSTAAERRAAIQAVWREPIELTEIIGLPETMRPRFMTSAALPKVSILIPTRNRHELLRVCMGGISRLEYSGELEIIVIDNESDDEETLEYLAHLECEGIIVIRQPGPFNFSAMNNMAARAATGEILCLLNNDVEMHDGIWLQAMVRHAMRPGIGAVGALLQYPDGTVQHAGVTIGTGDAAGHVYRGTPVTDAGHRDMHRLTRCVAAVTAACLVVRRATFVEVGGLDESALKVAFNDVDFCLKLLERGYRNILAGEAHLTHHESKSRGSDFSNDNFSRYVNELTHLQERWGTKDFVDPHHHPLIMRSSEKFVLAP